VKGCSGSREGETGVIASGNGVKQVGILYLVLEVAKVRDGCTTITIPSLKNQKRTMCVSVCAPHNKIKDQNETKRSGVVGIVMDSVGE